MPRMIVHVELRPLVSQDKMVIAKLANNKKIWDNLRDAIPFPYTEADATNFIAFAKTKNPLEIFGITVNRDLCGIIEISTQNDVYQKTGEIGYWIGEPYWGKGIGTEAIHLMTAYGFDVLQLERIQAGVFAFNPISMHVLEKNGYVKEGVFRKAIVKNRRICDEHRYAKLKGE